LGTQAGGLRPSIKLLNLDRAQTGRAVRATWRWPLRDGPAVSLSNLALLTSI